MPCYKPIRAYQAKDGTIQFAETKRTAGQLDLPCGQCIGCRIDRAREWSIRIMHEASLYENNCFVTLTYDDTHLPNDNNLEHRHWQLFAKKLRNHRGPFRYYMAGEYGDTDQRPHYHACIMGLDFHDAKHWKKNAAGTWTQTSEELQQLWPHGFATRGDLTPQSANYTARYVMKKHLGLAAAAYETIDENGVIHTRIPEYCRMSTRPGIGAHYYDRFHKDMHIHDHTILPGGIKQKVPRYYDKRADKRTIYDVSQLKAERTLNAQQHADNNTQERLKVRETIARAKLTLLKREL